MSLATAQAVALVAASAAHPVARSATRLVPPCFRCYQSHADSFCSAARSVTSHATAPRVDTVVVRTAVASVAASVVVEAVARPATPAEATAT